MVEARRARPLSAPEVALGHFCSNLSLGLHALAQPLTIVRASLFDGYTDRMSRGELLQLAGTLSLEVERVCSIFSCLQQLVHIEGIKPRLGAIAILPLLVDAVDAVELLFKKSGVVLSSVLPDSCSSVLANKERTLEALSSVILVAHALSSAGETVELIVTPYSKAIQVVIQNINVEAKALSAQASLSLACAGANLLSQQAKFSWRLEPFRVEICFNQVVGGSLEETDKGFPQGL